MRTATLSLKDGSSPATRKVIDNAIAVTVAPSQNSEKLALAGASTLRLLFDVTNTDTLNGVTFYIQVWLFSGISNTWHRGERVGISGNDTIDMAVHGVPFVQFEIDLIHYGGTTSPVPYSLDMWAGAVVTTGAYRAIV